MAAGTTLHYHVSMARTGPETEDASALQSRDSALELLRDVDSHMIAKGFRRDPAWGFVKTDAGRDGARFIRERRRTFSRQEEYVETVLTYELRDCDRADCELFDPELEEAREEAWRVERDTYETLRANFFTKHDLVYAHQEEINQWDRWGTEAVQHAARVYAGRCEQLRRAYEEYPLLLANLERNADYRRPSGSHEGARPLSLVGDLFLD